MTLRALIANNGNIVPNAMVARFYNGNPLAGGTQIGTPQTVPPLDDCAASTMVRGTWANVTPETCRIYVVVGNNTNASDVAVAASHNRSH